MLLRQAAGRYKRYPESARDLQWTGEVTVRLAVGPAGRLAALRVQESSGYRILDQQALETLRRAHAGVELPPALRDKAFTLQLRVIYRLDQESR